jgi:hypothetical protein
MCALPFTGPKAVVNEIAFALVTGVGSHLAVAGAKPSFAGGNARSISISSSASVKLISN